MTETQEIVFDDKSGISIEEQKEILAGINGITEKNRRSLSDGFRPDGLRGKKQVINAKKRGAFFPLVVNITALIVLFGGAVFLIPFYERVDAQVRTGSAVYNLTEKALIEDIRKDTAEQIAAKDIEIASIASRLEEVDALLSQVYSGQDLTPEQLDTLLLMQTSYREELAVLQDERSVILESSRVREAALRVQLEERARESFAYTVNSGGIDSAAAELERLTSEQEKIAAIDAYLAGGLVSAGALVQSRLYDQAAEVIADLRDFCNNNSLASARSFQTRREFYNQSINSMETIIDEMRKFTALNSEGWEMYEKNVQMEGIIAEMQKTIDAFSSGNSGQVRRISELEESVSSLRTSVSSLRASVSSLETSVSEKDRTISSLETERAGLSQTVSALQATNDAQGQEIANLRNQIELIRQALQN
ncbi:MAG: hypothetical protein LBQ89_00620 [Treponema sp.]|jgi:chromosome segregation ATPase|nr:hypothetical protein [Treponema sp.]